MTIQRMDNLGVVVDDLEADTAFFVGCPAVNKVNLTESGVGRATFLPEAASR